MHFHTTATISLGGLLLGTLALADNHPPVPGSYRPTEGGQIQNTLGDHQQFIPSSPSGTRYPAAIPTPGYAPPNYWNNNAPAPTPGFSTNPGRMMNNMFGGYNGLPYGYPAMTAPAQVAPVYDPPIPGAAPAWNYGTQPAYAQPAAPAYGAGQPAIPATNTYAPPATAYGSNTGTNQSAPSSTSPPPLEPTPSGQGRSKVNIRPAPRPYSNPQEAGQAFVQRPGNGRITYGGNDSRFRPPELKGTP